MSAKRRVSETEYRDPYPIAEDCFIAAANNGIDALTSGRLGFAFATHLHSDHTTGLADLVLAPCINDRPEWIESMADLVRREAR